MGPKPGPVKDDGPASGTAIGGAGPYGGEASCHAYGAGNGALETV